MCAAWPYSAHPREQEQQEELGQWLEEQQQQQCQQRPWVWLQAGSATLWRELSGRLMGCCSCCRAWPLLPQLPLLLLLGQPQQSLLL